jgi:hypothetical protein
MVACCVCSIRNLLGLPVPNYNSFAGFSRSSGLVQAQVENSRSRTHMALASGSLQ